MHDSPVWLYFFNFPLFSIDWNLSFSRFKSYFVWGTLNWHVCNLKKKENINFFSKSLQKPLASFLLYEDSKALDFYQLKETKSSKQIKKKMPLTFCIGISALDCLKILQGCCSCASLYRPWSKTVGCSLAYCTIVSFFSWHSCIELLDK